MERREVIKQWLGGCYRDGVVVAKVVMILAIPTTLLVFHVWNQYRITDLGYRIAEVTTEHRQLLEENKRLTVEAGIQGRSDRVSQVARRQFGLQEPRPEQIIAIDLHNDEGPTEHAALIDAATTPQGITRP